MRDRKNERGAVLAFAVIFMFVLIATLGMVIDGGSLYALKRRMQTGADAGALAVAHELRIENTDAYAAPGHYSVALNGFDGVNGAADVEINVPPTRGPKTGQPFFAEVIVRDEASLLFMRAFGRESTVVEARAVAGVYPQEACIWSLSDSASKALWVTGTADVNVNKCGIVVNSDSPTAAVTNGNTTVTAGSIGVVGGVSGSNFTPEPQTDIFPVDDPFKSLVMPTSLGCNHSGLLKIQTAATISPGVYCGGIEVTADGYLTMLPGYYEIAGGGLTVLGGGTIEGDGVTIYMTEGAGYPYKGVKLAGTSTSTLIAPKAGPTKGLLFVQDPTVKSLDGSTFGGTSDSYFDGVLYFKTTSLEYHGGANQTAQHITLIADTIQFYGNVNIEAPTQGSGVFPPELAIARLSE